MKFKFKVISCAVLERELELCASRSKNDIEVLLLERVEPRAGGCADGPASPLREGVAETRQEWRALVRGFRRRAGGGHSLQPFGPFFRLTY